MTASRSTATSTEDEAASGAGEIMLFGVRVVVDSMRKSVSLNDLCQYQQPQDLSFNNNPKEDAGAAGYASADDAVNNSSSGRERKRGVPWTEDEHRLFLLGLHKVGKGDWRGISRNFVKTRTPTQVASHAQKYFLRRSNLSRRRRRSSLFDITTETVAASSMEEEHVARQDIAQKPPPSPSPSPSPSFSLRHQPQAREICDPGQFQPTPAFAMPVGPTTFPVPIQNPSPKETGVDLICPLPLVSMPHTSFASHSSPNTNSIMEPPPSVSLDLSLSPSDRRESLSSRLPPFQLTARYKNGESMISVA